MRATPATIDAAATFLAAFDAAAALAGGATVDLALLGRSVRLRFAGPALVGAMTGAFVHRAGETTADPDLTVVLWDEESTGIAAPIAALGPQAGDATIQRGAATFMVSPAHDMVHGFDAASGVATYWVRRASAIPPADLCKPLLYLLHWWLADSPWQLVHGAAVGGASGGVLLAGPGGSGKSTTALACLRAGWRYAGDDYVAVRAAPVPSADGFFGTGRLRPDMAGRFPGLGVPLAPPAGEPAEAKACYLLAGDLPSARFGGFPLRAILLPRVEHRDDHRLERATRAEAFAYLATTVTVLRGATPAALAKVQALVGALPAWRLCLGRDIDFLPGFLAREIGIAP